MASALVSGCCSFLSATPESLSALLVTANSRQLCRTGRGIALLVSTRGEKKKITNKKIAAAPSSVFSLSSHYGPQLQPTSCFIPSCQRVLCGVASHTKRHLSLREQKVKRLCSASPCRSEETAEPFEMFLNPTRFHSENQTGFLMPDFGSSPF